MAVKVFSWPTQLLLRNAHIDKCITDHLIHCSNLDCVAPRCTWCVLVKMVVFRRKLVSSEVVVRVILVILSAFQKSTKKNFRRRKAVTFHQKVELPR